MFVVIVIKSPNCMILMMETDKKDASLMVRRLLTRELLSTANTNT